MNKLYILQIKNLIDENDIDEIFVLTSMGHCEAHNK